MPRYQRVEDIIQLALVLRAPGPGLCLEDVQRRFGVGRRTAERMREAVDRLYPGMTSSKGPDGCKYWRLPSGEASGQVARHPEELEALDEAAAEAERADRPDRSRALGSLRDKLRLLSKPADACDASRAGGDDGARERLRRAIVLERQVFLVHRGEGETVRSLVHPYGLLGGARPQLVAFHPGLEHALVHPLDAIEEVELLESGFERQPAIDLRCFAANAFAPFEEGPVEIAWRFCGEAARDACDYPFHPEQEITRRADGALDVRFRAEGLVLVAWHLFAWGDRARVLEPLLVKHRFEATLRRAREALPAAGPAPVAEALLED